MDIKLQQVSYAYSKDTPFEKSALHDVDVNNPIWIISSDYWSYRFRKIDNTTAF